LGYFGGFAIAAHSSKKAKMKAPITLVHVLRRGCRYHLQLLDAAGLDDTARFILVTFIIL
jgi:hypothetical protein